MSIGKELLEILACPKCKGPLVEEVDAVVCAPCRLKYPVRDGIPVLIVEEATPIPLLSSPLKGEGRDSGE